MGGMRGREMAEARAEKHPADVNAAAAHAS